MHNPLTAITWKIQPNIDIGRLLPYLLPYRTRFLFGLCFLFLASSAGLCFPLLVGGLIDAATHPNGTTLPGFGLLTVNRIALYLIGIIAIQSLATFAAILSFRLVGQSALAVLRLSVYKRLLLLPMSFFGQRRIGELASRMSSDCNQIEGALVNGLPQICRQAVVIIGAISLIAITSASLTLQLVLTLPFLVGAVSIFGRKIRQFSREIQDRLAECGVLVEESLQAVASVKAFTNEKFEVERYQEANAAVLKASLRSASWNAAFSGIAGAALFSGIIFVLWRGANLLQAGQLTAGELTRFILYTTYLAGAMGQVADLFGQIQKGIGATQRVQELLHEKTEQMLLNPTTSVDEHPSLRLVGAIEFVDVTFRYPSRQEVVVLADVSFALPPGQSLALVGPSGAGKSTITTLLLRFYEAESGSIRIGGKDLRDYPLDWLRSQIAIVPQDVMLFGGSIADNIGYGKPGSPLEEIREAARQANADVFIDKLPEGYATMVGDRGIKLSGGQRQRIAIARAFLKNPAILILDEATSSLDSESEQLIQSGLEILMRNRTTLIIAHRLATIRKVNHIAVMDKGRIVEFGPHDMLLGREKGHYRRLIELQQEGLSPTFLA